MLIADTGFWLALANRRDKHHERARDALTVVSEPLITTWPVLTETCHLLGTRLGNGAKEAFIQSGVRGAYSIYSIEATRLPRIAQLMKKYAQLPMDLADASLVLLAEHLGHGKILSTDQRDFRTYRWKHRKPFKNLLLP